MFPDEKNTQNLLVKAWVDRGVGCRVVYTRKLTFLYRKKKINRNDRMFFCVRLNFFIGQLFQPQLCGDGDDTFVNRLFQNTHTWFVPAGVSFFSFWSRRICFVFLTACTVPVLYSNHCKILISKCENHCLQANTDMRALHEPFKHKLNNETENKNKIK